MTDPIADAIRAKLDAAVANRHAKGLLLEVAMPDSVKTGADQGYWSCYPSSAAVKAEWAKKYVERGCFILNG